MILSKQVVDPDTTLSNLSMSPACEAAFCQAIATRTGIVLQAHQMMNLHQTVRTGCARFSFSGCDEYLNQVLSTPSLTPPLEYLVAGITVGESYFFRDSEQIALLRDHVLPAMIARKRGKVDQSLRIWSAGCSQGQEIYTMAMLLQELIPDYEAWNIHLLGTDINTEVLAKAVQGRYTEWSFRVMTSQQKHRWFTPVGHEYEIHSDLKKQARFSYLNLTEDIFPSILSDTQALDLILCRNVFIYLSRDVIRRTMERFSDCLVDDGVLILGASDPVEPDTPGLIWKQAGYTSYFHKQAPTQTTHVASKHVPKYPTLDSGPSFRLTQTPEKITAKPVIHPSASNSSPSVSQNHELDDASRKRVVQSLHQDDWKGVLEQIDTIEQQGNADSVLLQMKAQALASLGRMDEALHACTQSLALDSLNAHAYLVRALVLAEQGKADDAEAALRSALYLNRGFVEAHYELGMLNIRSGKVKAGIKQLENALKLAREGNPAQQFHNASGMTYSRFIDVLQNEIEIYRAVGENRRSQSVSNKSN